MAFIKCQYTNDYLLTIFQHPRDPKQYYDVRIDRLQSRKIHCYSCLYVDFISSGSFAFFFFTYESPTKKAAAYQN